jgi:hypothetical protein
MRVESGSDNVRREKEEQVESEPQKEDKESVKSRR